jgi:hypothetical protein
MRIHRFNPREHDLSFPGTGGKPFQIFGARVRSGARCAPSSLTAWDVWPYQLASEPARADSIVWEITAKAEGDKEPTDEARPMLRAERGSVSS